jgi:imidazolonepropionase-like amidohydrolase
VQPSSHPPHTPWPETTTGRDDLVIEGVDLIDGTGGPVVRDALIRVAGERIVYAGPRREGDTAPARRWRLQGKTVIPGLIEAHTHSTSDADMRAYVKNGITSIRFAGVDLPSVRRVRARIEAGELIGPRIFDCGPMLDQSPPAYPEWTIAVDTPAAAAAAAERLIVEEGVDALIVTQRITRRVLAAILEVAHAHAIPVTGQIWALDGEEAATLGIDQLDNPSRVFASAAYPRERLLAYDSIAQRLALSGRAWSAIDWVGTQRIIDAMLARGVHYCALLVACQIAAGEGVEEIDSDDDFATFFGEADRRAFRDFQRRLTSSWTPEDREWWKRANDVRLEWTRRFHTQGGKLVAGTDFQWGAIALHRELRNMADAGMSCAEVVTAATGGCARAFRVASRVGTVEAGRLADLVVLNRDPHRDLGALRDVAHVLKGGAVVWSAEAESVA